MHPLNSNILYIVILSGRVPTHLRQETEEKNGLKINHQTPYLFLLHALQLHSIKQQCVINE
jgi:hypothetical protein